MLEVVFNIQGKANEVVEVVDPINVTVTALDWNTLKEAVFKHEVGNVYLKEEAVTAKDGIQTAVYL